MARPIDPIPRIRAREGRYYVVWHDVAAGKSKARSLGTADPLKAQEAFARWLLEDQAAVQSRGPGELTVKQALADYLREHVLDKVADEERQRTAIDHLNAFFVGTKMSDVDIPLSRAYAKARRDGVIGGGKRRKDKTGSNATIRRELTVLTAAANHARRWKRLTAMPSIERPSEERARHDEVMPYFDTETMDLLFWAADGELLPWIRLCYYTAARRRSIENLTAEQVHLGRRQIVLATPGKARTKKRQPIVPIFKEILPDVAALVATRPRGRLFTTSSFYRPFMSLCRSLDLPEPHHPHMLRHSRATHLLQAGKAIWDVAGLLGDTVVTVQKTYGHHSPDDLLGKLS